MKLSRINLNLLIILEALLTECHVTRAAKKVFLSQSAMSCSLHQLRELFGDELLVREGRRMVLTQRAQTLLPAIQQILQQIHTTLESMQDFDPAISQRTFTLGLTEYADFLLLPRLYQHLHIHAPNIKLIVKHLIPLGTQQVFEKEEIELGVGIGMFYESSYLNYEIFSSEKMVCVARKNHPLLKKRLKLETYNQAKHLDLFLREQTFFGIDNEALASMNVKRDVHLVATHLMPGLSALSASDLIATVPEGLYKLAKQWFELTSQPIPFNLPAVAFTTVWHRRQQNDSGHQWLRNTIKNIISEIYAS